MTDRKTDVTAEVLVMENARAHDLIEAAEVLLERAGKFAVIRDESEAALASEYRARVNQQIKDLDAERLDMGEGLRTTLAKINERFNVPINALKAKLGAVDNALKAYLQEQRVLAEAMARAAREQEEQRLEAAVAARRAAVDAGLPPPEEPEPLPAVVIPEVPKMIEGSFGSKVSSREVWKYRIVDIKKVPEAFLVPVEDRVNKSALNAMARSMKGEAKVKGIEFYSEEILQSRVS